MPAAGTFDVVTMADMARPGDLGLRIAQELRVQKAMGWRSALLHLPAPRSGPVVPDLQACVGEGLAEVVDPEGEVFARLVVVHAPAALSALPDRPARIRADRVVLVHDRVPQPKQLGRWLGLLFGPMSWVPTNRWVRAAIDRLDLPVTVEEEDWRPIGTPGPAAPPVPRRRLRPLVGFVAGADRASWPCTPEALAALFPPEGAFDACFVGRPPAELLPEGGMPAAWSAFEPHDIALDRLAALVDALLCFPRAEDAEIPEAAIAAVMAAGRIVVLPPRLRPHFGPGALYCEPAEAAGRLAALLADPAAAAAAGAEAARHAGWQFPASAHGERIAALIGSAAPLRQAVRRAVPRALLVPSNGVGLGHVARLLAIARRTAGRFDPVFATMAQAAPIVEAFGFVAEYIPSLSDAGADPQAWDTWLRAEIAALAARHEIELVVYDGNNPTHGLVRAALARSGCRLAWVRRGMVGPVPSAFLGNARFCDLVIEPGELAAARDAGPTAARRAEALVVDPIRLLDPDELLGREEAAAALGLDPGRPAVLVQLGAGANRDLVPLVDETVRRLGAFPTLQVVLAEWANGEVPLALWPGVTRLRGFPVSQYFRAFDFAIGAAGYNGFHEAVAFELPTVFVANADPALDDQVARARWAQEAGVGLDLPEDQLFHLPAICEVLMQAPARAVVRQACRRWQRPNGAVAAADALAALVAGR